MTLGSDSTVFPWRPPSGATTVRLSSAHLARGPDTLLLTSFRRGELSEDPANRYPLLLRGELLQSWPQSSERRFMAIVYDTEVKIMSISSFNTLTLIHCPLQFRVLWGKRWFREYAWLLQGCLCEISWYSGFSASHVSLQDTFLLNTSYYSCPVNSTLVSFNPWTPDPE